VPTYLLFLENVFEYMEKYRYEPGMNAIISELERILADGTGTNIDQTHLLECRAACEKDVEKAIQLTQNALRLLGDITKENAHFASNLHSNLGALYHNQLKYDLAQLHMEQGIDLLEAYGLTGCHDSIIQINNYAVLLTDLGEAQRGYSALMKLSRKVRELNSDQCLYYGLIQQTLGTISLVQGNVQQANVHLNKAMAIFEMVFEDEPVLLEQKRQELEGMTSPVLQSIRKLLA